MKILNPVIAFFLILGLASCGGDTKEHKTLHEASDIHLEALKIKKTLEPDLEKLRQMSNGIQVQGRVLTPEEIHFAKAVDKIEARLEYWDQNHMEVPGFEHEGHDHSGHDHSHDHSTKFQLPADDILIVQKEFRDSILSIKGSVETLLTNMLK